MAVQLIYETHSTTRDNEAGIATGWLPGELSEAGVQNAADLGERRRDDGIDVIYASDLQRAVQSTQIALGTAGFQSVQTSGCVNATMAISTEHRLRR
ncbi:MAG: histidine phosphatase family protein [Geodermatophilaceae bacterium]